MAHKTRLGLRIIGITKLISAGLLAAVGFGVFHLMGGDMGMMLDHLVHKLHLNPGNHFIENAVSDISGISRGQLRAIEVGTFFYAALYLIEGIGLIKGRHWAEYLTVIATASLLPLEIYEIIHKTNTMKIIVLIANIAIVAYLIYQLCQSKKPCLKGDDMDCHSHEGGILS